MSNLSVDQTHRGFHFLDGPALDINPARWKAQIVSRECVGEIEPDAPRILEVAEILADFDFTLPKWNFSAGTRPLYPQFEDKEELLRYYLALSSINYEYFHLDNTESNGEPVRFQDGSMNGAELATSRLTANWDKLRNPNFLAELPHSFAETELFRAEVPIPRLGNRVDCLRSVGTMLTELERRGENLSSVFAMYSGNALEVSRFIADWVVGFKDEYLKRAQLYTAMVAGRFQERSDTPIDPASLEALTIIADYRVPQTMIGWGMLNISDHLRDQLNSCRPIREDSLWGQGLRAVPIVACDLLVERLNAIRADTNLGLPRVTSIHADPVIWAAPRQYQKAIAKGDELQIKKLEQLFIKGAEVRFPLIPTILL